MCACSVARPPLSVPWVCAAAQFGTVLLRVRYFEVSLPLQLYSDTVSRTRDVRRWRLAHTGQTFGHFPLWKFVYK
jgi:hypothetical protein